MADDLGKALLSLTNGISSTMVNVHNLNIAVLNSGSHYSMHDQCTNLRNDLKVLWAHDVSNLLQQIYRVIGDLIFLTKSVGQESEQECYTFFQETLQSMADIEISCRACISRNAEITQNLQLTSSQIMSLRHRHSFDVSMRHSSSCSSVSSSEDHSFVRSSLSAAYPCLSSSATSTLSSLRDTQNHLTAILHFSVALRKAGENVIAPSQIPKHYVSEDVRQMCLTSWETNRQDLHAAFLALTPIIDAITIEPSAKILQGRKSPGLTTCSTPMGPSSTIANPLGNVCYPANLPSTGQSPTSTENNGPSRQSSFTDARDSSQRLAPNLPESLDLVPLSCWKVVFFGYSRAKRRSDYPTTSNHTY